MQLKWGSYAFDAGSVEVISSQETMLNDAKIPYSFKRTMEVRGYLNGDGQTALSTATSALQTALARPFQDLILYQDDNSPSATLLRNRDALGGVVITRGPTFAETQQGSEYTTVRRFSFTAEAEYQIEGTGGILISFTERMTYSGGGPLYVMRRALNGPPQRQKVYEHTEYVVVQTGEAVGYRGYPALPPSRWPSWLKESPVVARTTPMRVGQAGYKNYKIMWEYRHESPIALVGAPTVWRG